MEGIITINNYYVLLILIFCVFIVIANRSNSQSEQSKSINELQILPTLRELLRLEKSSEDLGTSLSKESIRGIWKFNNVWEQGKEEESQLVVFLLKNFNATQELLEDQNAKDSNNIKIITSINFGLLYLLFSGYGKLSSKQRILRFYYESIDIRVGNNNIYSHRLKIPDNKDMPFFKFIGSSESEGWLSARGRGGGIAIWIRNKITPNN